MSAKAIGGIAYIASSALGFIPQIYKGKILFSPLLSLLTTISCIVKIFHYHCKRYNIVLLYQFIFIMALHTYLIRNYRQPLRSIEFMVFRPELYSKHGLGAYSLSVAATATVLAHICFLMGLGPVFGVVASLMDIVITFIQLLIYRNAADKPSELFACWIAGDLVKLGTMAFFYKAPPAYSLSIAVQVFMNLYVFLS